MKNADAILDHLKYGLAHVDGLCWLCDLLLAETPRGELCIQVGDRVLVRRDSIGILQNAVAESGLIYCRKLLNFLGLKGRRNSGTLFERPNAYGDDTVGIEDLNLPRVPLSALATTPFGEDAAVRCACEHTMRCADKGVAHFTEDRGERAAAEQIRLCAKTVAWLVEEFVYKPLNCPALVSRPWTAG